MARQLSKTQVRRAIEIGGERLNALALAEVEAQGYSVLVMKSRERVAGRS